MVPRCCVVLEPGALPLTASGKADRRALLQRPLSEDYFSSADETSDGPFTPLEARVARVWERVLGVPGLGRHADFSTLSGDSLTALHIVRELRSAFSLDEGVGTYAERGGALAPAALLQRPILRDFVEHLEATLGCHETETEQHHNTASPPKPTYPFLSLLLRCAAADVVDALHILFRTHAPPAQAVDAALGRACGTGARAAAAFLLAHGGRASAVDGEGRTAVHAAARAGATELLRMLLAAPNRMALARQQDAQCQSPLHHAARGGAGRRALDLLITAGADVHGRDAFGRTPLHWAVDNGHALTAQILVANGSRCNVADNADETPLAVARRRARCGAQDRPLGARASVYGAIATSLGGSGATRSLKESVA